MLRCISASSYGGLFLFWTVNEEDEQLVVNCSQLFWLIFEIDFLFRSHMDSFYPRVGETTRLLWVIGGSLLWIQGVIEHEMVILGFCFNRAWVSLFYCGVCWWIILPRRRVVGLSTQVGWCSTSVAGS